MTEAEAFTVLGLPDTATAAAIKEAHRQAAATHHPDRGGDASAFARAIQAYQVLRTTEEAREARRHTCPECRGKKVVILTSASWQAIRRLCATCRGKGSI